jgi:sigma-B regulation protein RsbU (phosphoserine phosphatase)
MSSLQARVQMLRETSPDPASAVTLLNRNFAERCPAGKFVTFFYALLDPQTGALKYSNAGHNYPLLLRANGAVEQLAGGGMVLGLFPMAHYELRETMLDPGDMLALYSDGVTEACTPTGEEFGEEGLARFLTQRKDESCSRLVSELVNYLRSWHGSNAFNDDFTVVLVRRER